MALGECSCGSVAFEVNCELTEVFICHCSICRRSTGSNGIAVVVVNNSDFTWLRGKQLIRNWHKPGHDWQKSFCSQCGSPLPDQNDPARIYIPAGLLTEGDEQLKVTHHIWVDSKADWDVIGDSGKQHHQEFTG